MTRYGTTDTVRIATLTCLWWGSLHRVPVTVVLIRDTDSTRPYDIALVSTDTEAPVEALISRYADRWSVEQTIKDAKILLGAGMKWSYHRSAWRTITGHEGYDEEMLAACTAAPRYARSSLSWNARGDGRLTATLAAERILRAFRESQDVVAN